VAGIQQEGEGFTINLYPMLDIFSILIIFLLMNFSSAGESVETKANLQLPRSIVKMTLDASASVSITKNEIIIQGATSIPIGPDGDVPASFREQGAIRVAYEKFKELKKYNATLRNRDKSLNLSEADINTLVLESDRQVLFKIIKRVMLSAQQAEFIAWKLAFEKLDMN
jgi:hypothetical protein